MTDGETPLPLPFGYRDSALYVEDVPVSELAARYGTPLYVTSEARLRENARKLFGAFRPQWPRFSLLYAVKANSNPAIVRILASEGCGADCSNPAEIRIAVDAGVPSDRILYTGAYPRTEELAAAIDAGVRVNLDDPELLPRLLACGRPPALSFRVNPGETEAGPEGLRFAGPDAKFGAPLEPVVDGLRAAAAAGIRRLGLHTMPGSNILDPAHFGRLGRFLATAARRIRAAGIELEFLDFGGGLGVPYRPSESPLDVTEVARQIATALRSAYPDGTAAPTLFAEPGRYLVADSTILVTRVTHTKAHPIPFVGVDAGMHTLLRPALYGAYHPVYAVERRETEPHPIQHVGGPVCENTDVLARDRRLPRLRRDDLIALGIAGAYGFSMSSQYNNRPRAAEVLVRGAEGFPIRERERFEDLVARTRLPPHLTGTLLPPPVGPSGGR